MNKIAFVIRHSHMGFNEVMDLPYLIFHSLFRNFVLDEMQKTEDGREAIRKDKLVRYVRENNLTKPDFEKIRNSDGYKVKKKNNVGQFLLSPFLMKGVSIDGKCN